jgi:hypothetical protein
MELAATCDARHTGIAGARVTVVVGRVRSAPYRDAIGDPRPAGLSCMIGDGQWRAN